MTTLLRFFIFSFVALATLVPRSAAAALSLCADVHAPPADLEWLRKRVRTEVEPRHRVVDEGCRSTLRVEVFEASNARYVKAQLDREVPVEVKLDETSDLGDQVSRAVKIAVHEDPLALRGDVGPWLITTRMGAHGRTLLRTELFGAITSAGRNAAFTPGAAIGFHWGWSYVRAFGRFYVGAAPWGISGMDRSLQILTGIDGGLSFELLPTRFASPYLGAALGARFERFGGRAQPTNKWFDHVDHLGWNASLRAGVRMFRWHSVDLDLFVQAYGPFSRTKDAQEKLFSKEGILTPSLQAGIGVGF